MVSIRSVHQKKRPAFEEWLLSLDVPEHTKKAIESISETPDILLIGQEMVEVLHQLHMDDETLQAAFVFPYCQIHQLDEDQIEAKFGGNIKTLIVGVRKMDAIKSLQARSQQHSEQHVDNIRRMLLAMVEDVRAVVIKMAERICTLQQVKKADEETRVMVARECSTIYAPLANRLGIGQLKWEMEDMAFRYLHPITYKQIANWLDEKRIVREKYIDDLVINLQTLLDKENIQAEVIGRPKHIYSIWKKMQKKRLDFDQLYDIRALRIVAVRLQDCYAALGVVHSHWQHIQSEFDDYIATPKINGYQSVHTVIIGPEDKSVEIQIRTRQMHQDAELGVAAHWKYKEGAATKGDGFDDRINWLRKILQWQEEVAESGNIVEELRSQVFDDRVYVFTPKGDVIDLPLGSTPLDFAYYVHSNVGHRCIGAKVNKRIVPFTYLLQSGDQIEILTGKEPNPSRDWMHPGLGYVHSSRARATIHSFFKKLDKDKNVDAGKELLERELSKVNLSLKLAADVREKFNMKTMDDLHAAIGIGDVRIMTVVNAVLHLHAPPEPELTVADLPSMKVKRSPKQKKSAEPIIVEGVGHLMSQIAKCCQPVAGEPIMGYITLGRGVSVHNEQCNQLQHLLDEHPERQIEVNWSSEQSRFETEVELICNDRNGLLKDVTTVLANEKVSLLAVNSISNKSLNTAHIKITIEVNNLNTLQKTIQHLKLVKGMADVIRG